MRRFRSIRWRLTLWYSVFLLGTLIVSGAAIYVGLSHVLQDNFADQLQQEVLLAQTGVSRENGKLTFEPAALAEYDEEHFIRVITNTGKVIADTSDEDDHAPVLKLGNDPTKARFKWVELDDTPFGIAAAPVVIDGRVVGRIEIGRSRAAIDEALRTLKLIFTIALPILLGFAGIGGYLVSGRALAPVDEITSMAANINPDDLGQRLDLDLPDDELGRLARTFDAMLARIETAFERQRQFTGNAAHEMRTPLSLMRSQVELTLSRPRNPAEYQEALTNLHGDIDRLTTIVTMLLSLARADSEKLQLAREPSDLGEIVPLVLDSYTPQAKDAGVRLLDRSTPTPVNVDDDLIVQLLVNLIDNALAHTPSGGTITVGTETTIGRTCLWVEDSGSGIAPEHQPRIFERFYRADSGRSRGEGGVGLGLAFCKAIAEAHGGTLSVTSESGHGARFDFCLPAT
jgi:heavy metal sensor kinase